MAGVDRYETSSEIALNGWTQCDYAVLASGEDYPDALCAAPLAGKYKAPILLTEKDSIPETTLSTIKQLQVKNIFIIGGTGVISNTVEDQLKLLGISITRLFGQNRYETDIAVAKQLGTVSQIAVVTGEDYADALSIAPIAVKLNIPIILVGQNIIPQAVTDYIVSQSIAKTYVIGKGTSITDETGLPNVTEINGADRYARNIAIVSAFKDSLDFSTIYLATGENFADALSGSVLAGINGNPLILVGSDITNEENLLQLVAPNATIKVLGGIGSVPDDTVIGIDNPFTPITVDPISPIPTNVEATIGSNGVVNITWYPIDTVNSYKVYYSIDNVSYTSTDNLRVYENFIHIDLDDISALSKIIDKPIYFKVTSILSGKESAFSSYTSVIPAVISTIPTGVRASWGGDDIVNLDWNLVGTKNSYNVYYSTDNVTYTNTGNTNGSGMFLHLNYIPKLSGIKNKIIYFKVTSVLNGIESVFSSCSAVFIGKITVDTSDLNVSQIDFISTQLTKTGDTTATFKYKILNKAGVDITKAIPYSQLYAVASVSSSINLEGLTGTGTIIFKSSSDIDKSIIIKIVDTVSGITKNSIGEHTAAKKIVKITIKSTKLGYANNSAYAMYEVYDQNGNDITNDAISSNLTFQSSGGTVTGKHGLLTLTGVDFAQSGTSIFTVPTTGVSYSVAERGTFEITVTDPATKVSTSAKLIVIDAGSETEIVK